MLSPKIPVKISHRASTLQIENTGIFYQGIPYKPTSASNVFTLNLFHRHFSSLLKHFLLFAREVVEFHRLVLQCCTVARRDKTLPRIQKHVFSVLGFFKM